MNLKGQFNFNGRIQRKAGHAHGGARVAPRIAVLNRIFSRKSIRITIDLGVGKYQATGWTCDLSTSYVRINSAYRT